MVAYDYIVAGLVMGIPTFKKISTIITTQITPSLSLNTHSTGRRRLSLLKYRCPHMGGDYGENSSGFERGDWSEVW